MDSPDFNLDIALRKFHQLGMEDGDLGAEYWNHISRLLKQAADMDARLERLSQELRDCQARLPPEEGDEAVDEDPGYCVFCKRGG